MASRHQRFKQLAWRGAILFYDEAASFACVKGEVPEHDRECDSPDNAARAYNPTRTRPRLGMVRVINCR
jgi:hypothetical protein